MDKEGGSGVGRVARPADVSPSFHHCISHGCGVCTGDSPLLLCYVQYLLFKLTVLDSDGPLSSSLPGKCSTYSKMPAKWSMF